VAPARNPWRVGHRPAPSVNAVTIASVSLLFAGLRVWPEPGLTRYSPGGLSQGQRQLRRYIIELALLATT
jgi:hypothetical protein